MDLIDYSVRYTYRTPMGVEEESEIIMATSPEMALVHFGVVLAEYRNILKNLIKVEVEVC